MADSSIIRAIMIDLMMEAESTSETSFYFYKTTTAQQPTRLILSYSI
jgi:hypothetical protein